jgi:putative transposase
MNLTMQLKLLPAPEQAQSLLTTMEKFNAACSQLVATAFQHHCTDAAKLQSLAYHDIRASSGLSSHMIMNAIAQAAEVARQGNHGQRTFPPHDSLFYDQQSLAWEGADRVSLWTLDGHAAMPWVCSAYPGDMPNRQRGQADLLYNDGAFSLFVTIDIGHEKNRDAYRRV